MMKFNTTLEAIQYIDEQIKVLQKNSGVTSNERCIAYSHAVTVIREQELAFFYKIDGREHFYQNRLVKVREYVESFEEHEPKEECGCYLIGNTAFNPMTKEEFYFIKIGKSVNIKKRMKTYSSCCPSITKIDYLTCEEERLNSLENHCHTELWRLGEQVKNRGSREWFRVSREVYLNLCDTGFKNLILNY